MKKIILLIFLFMNYTTLTSENHFEKHAYIASFNTLHLGWEKKNIEAFTDILAYFDLVGLQEVMNKKSVKKIVKTLNKKTGEKWAYHISPYSVGSSKYREYFAYIWRKNKVKIINKKRGFYPNKNLEFKRKPYGADFKIGNTDFTYVLLHSIYGKKKTNRQLESLYLTKLYDYFQSLDENENDILIGGDFNIPATDESFSALLNHKEDIFFAINPYRKTTIGKKGLASSYDNFFYSRKYFSEYTGYSGILNFTNGEYEKSQRDISDHLPIFIEIDITKDDD